MKLKGFILQRMFGRPSGLLGWLGGIVMARTRRDFVEWVISQLDIRSTDSVLEVGYGPGLAVELIAEIAGEGFVAGVDPSAVMVKQATTRNAKGIEAGHVDLKQGLAEDLPFEAGLFHKALAINSFQMWHDPSRGLNELARVLKPSGLAALGFTRHSGQALDDVISLVKASNLTTMRSRVTGDGFLLLAEN